MMKKSISWMVFLLLMMAACAQAAPQLTNVTADGESLHAGEGWTVSFETTEGGALAMQLRGTEGETVDLGATQVDAGSGQLVWDGVLPDGSEAADGVYTVAVQLRNYWGEESEESLLPLTIGETKEELEKVLELKVDLLQGYYLARPAAVPQEVNPDAVKIIREKSREI